MVTCWDSGWTYLSGAFLGYGVISGLEIIHPDGSVRPGHHVFFNTIAGNVERNTGDLSIFGGFHKLQGACS